MNPKRTFLSLPILRNNSFHALSFIGGGGFLALLFSYSRSSIRPDLFFLLCAAMIFREWLWFLITASGLFFIEVFFAYSPLAFGVSYWLLGTFLFFALQATRREFSITMIIFFLGSSLFFVSYAYMTKILFIQSGFVIEEIILHSVIAFPFCWILFRFCYEN